MSVQVRYAVGRGISQRSACTLLSVARSGLGYQCKMPVKDRPIVAAMRQYSEQYPRHGARRIRVFLRRDDLVLGRDRAARIWAGAGLQVPAKRTRNECLAMNWFDSRAHAKILIEQWRKHYNLIRPHSSLDYQTPAEFIAGWQKELTTGARVSR